MHKQILAALGVAVMAAAAPTALAGDFASACTEAAQSGAIELPEGMDADTAEAVCGCLGANASADMTPELMASLDIYALDERMASLSPEAVAVFDSCASG